MKSAAVREARQVARMKTGRWRAQCVPDDEIVARLRVPQDVRQAYDRLSHRDRGRARARWRRMIAAARPDLTTKRDSRPYRATLNRMHWSHPV